MRTLEIKLYKFEELSEQAQDQAIRQMAQDAFESASECDWRDANDSMNQVKEMAQIDCDIRESSQGFYVHWGYDHSGYEKTDRQLFKELIKKIEAWKIGTWSDDMLKNRFLSAVFNKNRSYISNVSDILVDYCNEVYRMTIDYYEDEHVREYIIGNDIEFYENGNPYK